MLFRSDYFGIEAVVAPVDDQGAVDVDFVREHITPRTVALVGSAGTYPHGVIDPIPQLGALALEHDLGLHIDGCLGGFILAWAESCGYPITPFDFSVPGVTSISIDTHKYGFGFKGSSVVLFKPHTLRRFHYYVMNGWPGGLYGSPGIAGSRSGGIIASAQVGLALGMPNIISFDMGGTTAKASLIREGEPTLAPGYYVGGYASGHPVMLPMIDVVEVGAGGGSIAWRDDVGALKVGPQSAGADPGPIAYRGGGTEPTITDANVVLGRLDPDNFLGGTMKLDADGARRGIEQKIAKPLGIDTIAAAKAIVEIAINKMSLAVREVSVAKGYDPRDFALVASGGAGPLHVCAIARELYIPTVIVPLFPSHFSALGMLLADERHDFTRTVYSDLANVDFAALVKVHDEMVKDAKAALRHNKDALFQIHLDLRYLGQEFTLQVPVTLDQLKTGDRKAIRTAFDEMYEHRYAHHSPDEAVELVNIRLGAIGKRAKLKFPSLGAAGEAKPAGERKAYFSSATEALTAKVYRREQLGAGAELSGPALIQEHGTTTVLFENDHCRVAPSGELIISIGGVR